MTDLTLAVAIAFVWSRGTIFAELRSTGPDWWRALAGCPLCSGFWVGVLCKLASMFGSAWLVEWLGWGSLVGATTLILCALVRRI